MDGVSSIYSLGRLVQEDASSGMWDVYLAYQFLNEAAIDWTVRTKCIRSSQAITTIASTSAYNLNPDYLGLYLRDSNKNFFIKYYDSTNTSFINQCEYSDLILANSDYQALPDRFAVIDNPTLPTRITGTASAIGAASGGECTLTDTSSSTKFATVSAGDNVHNTTDGSTGIVLSKTSDTALVVALFNGTNNDWTSADAYVIQPQPRKQIILEPPSSTAGHTVTVYYVQKPAPVYSNYGMFRFDAEVSNALIKYAAWLYKYRDKDPNYGDKWFQHYENQIGIYNKTVNNTLKKTTWTFSLKA